MNIRLESDKRTVEAVAEALAAEVRDACGASSLAHLLVVVPTAESGRRLRLALARRFSRGVLPPEIRMPAAFLLPEDVAETLPSRAEELAALWEARGGKDTTLDIAAQLADIRRILCTNALSFEDVAQRVTALDQPRWQELADLERRYRAILARYGKTDRVLAIRQAMDRPTLPAGIEKVIVAGVADAPPAFARALAHCGVPVDHYELASPPEKVILARSQIHAFATAADEAEHIASVFAHVAPDEALPALCVADPALYPEIASALEAKGFRLHNPSATRLITSSLGRLVSQIVALQRTASYNVFSAFVRGGDVRNWLMRTLHFKGGVDPATAITRALEDLDHRQAEFLPETIDDIAPKTSGTLRAIFDLVQTTLRKRDVRSTLGRIFAEKTLDARHPEDREFAAAAAVVNDLILECEGVALPEAQRRDLFARRLDEATYSTEPDAGDIILTDGWLELPYLEADELILAGFQEGCVPESVVGHAFLPDALRVTLGLPNNAARGARDALLLRRALACRETAAVQVTFHSVDAQGDVLKPSRLVFAGTDDAELAARASAYYTMRAGTREARPATLPEAWRLPLPIPPEHRVLGKTSPTGIDAYLRCPFTYYLCAVFGDKRLDDRAEELEVWEYGNLAHGALDAWGRSALKDSEDAAEIAQALEGHVDGILGERFGTAIPAIVAMQGESVKRRLRDFAAIQVGRHQAGWRIVETEETREVVYGATRVRGRCDRVDYNDRTGQWCILDYKTWDSTDKAKIFDARKKAWLSLQLPIYCAMLAMDNREAFKTAQLENIQAAYCVLGKTRDNVRFTEPFYGDETRTAEACIRTLIARIERGIFWPPSEDDEWRWHFKDWMFDNSPEGSVPAAWLADQCRRIHAAEGLEK